MLNTVFLGIIAIELGIIAWRKKESKISGEEVLKIMREQLKDLS